MRQAYTFIRTEERTTVYKTTIIAESLDDAKSYYETQKETGEFYDDAEIDFEDITDVTEEVEYEDEWDYSTVRETL